MKKKKDIEKPQSKPQEEPVQEPEAKVNAEPQAESETEKLQRELAEANDKYLRLMAEFDNYRRRTARERLDLIETAGEDVLKGFLPTLDDCERALETLRNSDASAAAIEGTEIILNKLTNYLKSKGVEKIDAKGKPFNTDEHEAIAQFPAPTPEQKNTVIDVTQNGYLLHGKATRPLIRSCRPRSWPSSTSRRPPFVCR